MEILYFSDPREKKFNGKITLKKIYDGRKCKKILGKIIFLGKFFLMVEVLGKIFFDSKVLGKIIFIPRIIFSKDVFGRIFLMVDCSGL